MVLPRQRSTHVDLTHTMPCLMGESEEWWNRIQWECPMHLCTYRWQDTREIKMTIGFRPTKQVDFWHSSQGRRKWKSYSLFSMVYWGILNHQELLSGSITLFWLWSRKVLLYSVTGSVSPWSPSGTAETAEQLLFSQQATTLSSCLAFPLWLLTSVVILSSKVHKICQIPSTFTGPRYTCHNFPCLHNPTPTSPYKWSDELACSARHTVIRWCNTATKTLLPVTVVSASVATGNCISVVWGNSAFITEIRSTNRWKSSLVLGWICRNLCTKNKKATHHQTIRWSKTKVYTITNK